jgi:hypothetical protein
VGTVAPRLIKGTEVYCERRQSLWTWTGRDGEARTWLNLAVWEAQPMGQIGRRKAKARSRDEYEPPRDERDAVPFDDPLRF